MDFVFTGSVVIQVDGGKCRGKLLIITAPPGPTYGTITILFYSQVFQLVYQVNVAADAKLYILVFVKQVL